MAHAKIYVLIDDGWSYICIFNVCFEKLSRRSQSLTSNTLKASSIKTRRIQVHGLTAGSILGEH